jgi:hypothetical protein
MYYLIIVIVILMSLHVSTPLGVIIKSYKELRKTIQLHMRIGQTGSCMPGVFNLSDSAGHINNFNDARGPQSYT